MNDRMPPLPLDRMDPAQRAAAEALIAGPRKAVIGPFIPLLRSPELLRRLRGVGRIYSSIEVRLRREESCLTLTVADDGAPDYIESKERTA